MTSVGVGPEKSGHGARKTDFDAAQALLDLQSNINLETRTDSCELDRSDWRENKEDLEKAAKLFLNCFISSDVPISTTKATQHANTTENNSHYPTNTPMDYQICNQHHKTRVNESFQITHKSYPKSFDKSSSSNSVGVVSVSDIESRYKNSYKTIRYDKTTSNNTRDAGTQTEEKYFNPNIQLMETTIKDLCDRIKSLEAQLQTTHSESAEQPIENATFGTPPRQSFPLSFEYDSDDCDNDPDYEMTVKYTDNTANGTYSRRSEFDLSTYNDSYTRQTNNKIMYNGILTSRNTNSRDLVSIGDGHATVPSRLLKHINWNSYSSATRKLLTAVFSRRILATHSLTGKPSPAFPNKPAKKRLDPVLVNDIVQTVVERCRVPENVVRTSITTKCADESKMFRTRENNKKKRSNKKNRENVPPATSDSEFDDY